MHLIEVSKARLEVRQIAAPGRAKTRSPIVFLHEGLGSVSLWNQRGQDWPLAVCEATGRSGLVYSRRGYGLSDPAERDRPTDSHPTLLPADYMHKQAWDVLPALLGHLQIESPVLLGHSDGATIALLYASRFPVSACIAMAPHVTVEDVALNAISEARVAFEAGALRERLSRYHADVDGAFWQWNDVWLSAAFRQFDIRRDCQSISAPLLLVQGSDDEYGSMLQLDEVARSAPHAMQLRLANCGHSPHRDQPAETTAAIAAFLASRP